MPAARRIAGVVAGCLVGLSAAPAPAADQQKISEAIARGAEYLKKTCGQGYDGGAYKSGAAALSGLALLEAGTPATDPTVQHLAGLVRSQALPNSQTYHLALAVLFLDRLGEPSDGPLIQFLGVRLYAGMTAFGGWTYNCGGDLSPAEVAQLQAALRQNNLVGRPAGKQPKQPANGFLPPPKRDPTKDDAPPDKLHPEVAKHFLAARQVARSGGRSPIEGDNSNTQFGMIGLWVAARHGVPADDAFALIEARFLTTQNKADFGWSYQGGPGGGSTPAMTCAGLLGLAIGAARRKPEPAADPRQAKDPNNPFDAPPKKDKDAGGKAAGDDPVRKQAINNALAALGGVLRAGRGGGGLNNFVGIGNEYYLLWSIERVGVAYSLETIGDVNWHNWGADILLPMQVPDGSWPNSGYSTDVNTSFAILFLSKSNFVRDLSRKIEGVAGKTELRGGGGVPPPLMTAPKQANDNPAAGAKPPVEPPPPPLPEVKAGAGDPLADALVEASADDWPRKLAAARDTKGADHTGALVRAIPRLDGDRQKQARQALADRLTRMTANTLRGMLKADEPELRRAACLACAMKEDRSHIPDLIDRLTDPSDLVVRAARAGLRSLTEKDFGPPAGADDAAKAKAQAEWKKWYESGGKP